MKIVIETPNKMPLICRLFHSWILILDNGHSIYKQCSRCPARMMTQPDNEDYEPFDMEWLLGTSDLITNIK